MAFDPIAFNRARNMSAKRVIIASGCGSAISESPEAATPGPLDVMQSRFLFKNGDQPATDLQVMFDGTNKQGVNNTNDMTITGAIETVAPYPIYFRKYTWNQADSLVLRPGSLPVASDSIPIGLAPNQSFYARQQVDVVSPDKTSWCSNRKYTGAGLDVVRSGTKPVASSIWGTGTINGFAGQNSTSIGLRPFAITGLPSAPIVSCAIIGTSIERGSDDIGTGSTTGAVGYIERALMAPVGRTEIPYTNLAIFGSFIQGWYGTGGLHRSAYFPYVTHVIMGFPTNDFPAYTFAQTQTHYGYVCGLARQAGAKIIALLNFPKTNAGNTAVLNAAFTPPGGDAYLMREWIRNGAQTVGGVRQVDMVIDPAVGVAAVDGNGDMTGLWLGGMTADGTHPTTLGHSTAAANLATAFGRLAP